MLKGCRKNVVYVKNTDSELFEEAYFIVSDSSAAKNKCENDMLKEASRIISNGPMRSYFSDGKNTSDEKKGDIGKALWFVLGATVTAALNAVFFFII